MRKVVIILLQLNRFSVARESGAISYNRIQRTLQAVINRPDLATLPALRNLANFTLLSFENIEKGKSNTPSSPLSAELESIRIANAEITSILPPTETALETLIYNYVSDSLQGLPARYDQEPLNRLLGYTFVDRHGNHLQPSGAHDPHIQRAREIMGPQISETIDICRGFWCPLLSVENFFALVAAHQVHGGVRSKGFRKLLGEVEAEIEEGLRVGVRRVREGYPYRFGASAKGLERLKQGETLSYRDQLLCLEAQGRLRYMQVHRERRDEWVRRDRKEERKDVWREGKPPKQVGEEQ